MAPAIPLQPVGDPTRDDHELCGEKGHCHKLPFLGTNSLTRADRIGLSLSSPAEIILRSIDKSSDLKRTADQRSTLFTVTDQSLPRNEDGPIPVRKVWHQPVECKSSAGCQPLSESNASFATLHITYLFVTFVVMLADGLQGKALLARVICFVQHSLNLPTNDFHTTFCICFRHAHICSLRRIWLFRRLLVLSRICHWRSLVSYHGTAGRHDWAQESSHIVLLARNLYQPFGAVSISLRAGCQSHD